MMMHELANFKDVCIGGGDIYVFVHPLGVPWHDVDIALVSHTQ
jgi:hypothetical protein